MGKAEHDAKMAARRAGDARKREIEEATRDLMAACGSGTNAELVKAARDFTACVFREAVLDIDRRSALAQVDRRRAELTLACLKGEGAEIDGAAYMLVHELQDIDDEHGRLTVQMEAGHMAERDPDA